MNIKGLVFVGIILSQITTQAADVVEQPEWIGNKLGITDKVPVPWIPMQVVRSDNQDIAIQCWGRIYSYKNSLFPVQIVSQGKELLEQPIRLVGSAGDKELLNGEANVQVVTQRDDYVTIIADGTVGSIHVSTRTRIEFDGMVWIEMGLNTPPGLTIETLTLELPLKRKQCALFYSGDTSTEMTGLLNPNGWYGPISDWNVDIGGRFSGHIWLGDEEAGLEWFAPSPRNWRVKETNRMIEYTVAPKAVTLKVHFIGKSTTLEKERNIAFGLIATPVRSKPKNWQSWRMTSGNETSPKAQTANTEMGFSQWYSYYCYPIPSKKDVEAVKNAKKEKLRLILYASTIYGSPRSPAYKIFGKEWRTDPFSLQGSFVDVGENTKEPNVEGLEWVTFCPRSSYTDFLLWYLPQLIQTMGLQDDGIYFDDYPPTCKNTRHGCGYKGHAEPQILALREFYKRFYITMKERYPNFKIFIHHSGQINMSYLGFCDGYIDGENLGVKKEKGNYYDISLDKFRAEFTGHPFGIPCIFLPEFNRREPEFNWYGNERLNEVEHLAGLILLHNSQLWASLANPKVWETLWEIQDTLKWDDNLEFFPYWNNTAYIQLTPEDPKIVASIYKNYGKIMVVILNNTDENKEVKINLNLEKIGLQEDAIRQLRDPIRSKTFESVKGEIQVQVERRNYRALVGE